MAWVIQFDSQMLKDGYTISAAMVYGYLWWCTCKTRLNGDVKPSLGLMSNALCLNRRTIIRAIKELEDKKLIEVFRQQNKKSCYFVYDINKYPAISGELDMNRLFSCYNREMFKKKWGQNVTR